VKGRTLVVGLCGGRGGFAGERRGRGGGGSREVDVPPPRGRGGVGPPPRLIVANACVSGALSKVGAGGQPAAAAAANAPGAAPLIGDARIVAGLADEFFRRGVGDFIGTAWEVPESPAKLFAEHLYKAL